MKHLIIILLTILIILCPLLVLASDISDADYSGVVTISNNGTSTSQVSTVLTLDTADLIALGILDASANSSALLSASGADVAFMPGYPTNPWCLWVSDIDTNSHLIYTLYTAYTGITGGKQRYFPGTGGMTTADNNSSLELGNNLTIEQKAFFTTNETGAKPLFKDDAYQIYYPASGNVTAGIQLPNIEYIENDDNQLGRSGTTQWGAEIFTVNRATLLNEISTKVWAAVASTDLYFQINGVTTGQPNATVYSTGNYTADNLSTSAPGAWIVIPMTDISMTAGNYSLIMYGTASNQWRIDTVSAYSGSSWYSNDSGSTWSETPDTDQMFSVRGMVVVSATVSSGEHTIIATEEPALNFTDLDYEITTASFDIDPDHTLNNFTWLAWINPDSVSSTYMLHKAQGNYLDIYMGAASGKLFIWDYGASTYKTTTTSPLQVGIWQMVGVTKSDDGDSGTVTFYYNGTQTGNAAACSASWASTASVHYIGNSNGSGSTQYYGDIAEELLYNRVLTPTEISNFYNGIEPSTSQLRLWYKLNEDTGTAITDSSGNGYNGTIPYESWATTDFPFKLFVDSELQSATEGISVPNNANPIISFPNTAVAYAEYQKLYVDGNLKQHIAWQYGTAFTDLSGNGNTATPTFRTTSSDADVTANISNFKPVTEAKAPAYAINSSSFTLIGDNITITSSFSTTVSSGYPGEQIIEDIASATNTPVQLPAILISTFIILGLSLSGSYFLRKHGETSLFVKLGLVACLAGVAVGLSIYDFWMVLGFLLIAAALTMMAQHRW